MIMKEKQTNGSYLFNVDILIEEESNARALERLLHLLNRSGAADFRIQSGIELGRMIESLTNQSESSTDEASGPRLNLVPPLQHTAADEAAPLAKKRTGTPKSTVAAASEARSDALSPMAADQRIHAFIEQNKLIRLHVNKGRGIKLSIPCRIVKFDEEQGNVTVYHVDEKQVYTFSVNEIDDFIE
ncbi:hypothetical protein [Paenibacillus sp. 1P07SE]|uniref:hypothetical protein n=1 Tax=Paenibacillus sp. 1P07SE TaxID=3132209 RepID=UPI0039A6345A